MTYADAIAKRILQICSERDITPNKLATISGLRQSTISNIINSDVKIPSLRTIHRMSVGLNMTVSEFLDFDTMNTAVFEDE